MNLDQILSEIDLEISRLQQAKQLLSEDSGTPAKIKRGPGRPPSSSTSSKAASAAPRTMSAAGRARIAAAQKARWAKVKKAEKKTAPAKNAASKAVSSKAAPAKKAALKQSKPTKAAAGAKTEITPAAS